MTDDLATKIAQLEALRPTFGDAWVDAKVAELRNVQPQLKGNTTRVGDVRDATGVAVGMGASVNVMQGPRVDNAQGHINMATYQTNNYGGVARGAAAGGQPTCDSIRPNPPRRRAGRGAVAARGRYA